MHNPSAYFSWGKFSNDKKAKFQYQEFTLARADAYWNAKHGYLESLEAGIGWKASTFKSLNLSLQLVNNYEYVADSLDFGNNIIIRKGNYNSPGAWLFITPPKYKKIQVPVTLSQSRFFGVIAFTTSAQKQIFAYPFEFEKSFLERSDYDAYFLDDSKSSDYAFVMKDNKKAVYVLTGKDFK
ncbi:hypothetical protein HMI54_013465, partial [Coelomomyces lativittatus]